MPDHVHFVIFFTQDVDYHLGDVINDFKGGVTRSFSYGSIFNEGYHDRICRYRGQLERMRNYVMENPGRWFIRRDGKKYFHDPMLINLYGWNYIAYGNFLLLKNPDISTITISRHDTPDILDAKYKNWEETVRGNGVFASPFISAKEKSIRNKGLESGVNLIHITRNPITGPKWTPPGEEMTKLCSAGRLLILSTMKGAEDSKLTKPEAKEMNELTIRLSQEPPANPILKPIRWK